MPWSTFLRAHRECLVATDFLTLEVCTIRALVTHNVLFFIDIVNRAVKIAGITPHTDSRWMRQIARNLTDPNHGFLRGKRYLILDRDTKYSDAFGSVLVREGIQVVRLPARSPNLNAFAERFVRSIKEECLSRMIFFAPASLQHALRQFMAHYHTERNHQGLENRIPQPMSVVAHRPDRFGPHPHLAGVGERVQPLGLQLTGGQIEIFALVAGPAGQNGPAPRPGRKHPPTALQNLPHRLDRKSKRLNSSHL